MLFLSLLHLTSSAKETREFKHICLKRIWYPFISLLTPKVNVVRLNSRIPLTCVNLMWTQSWGILTLGPANYWLIISSDTGHSRSLSQILTLAHLCWQKLNPTQTLATLLNFIKRVWVELCWSWCNMVVGMLLCVWDSTFHSVKYPQMIPSFITLTPSLSCLKESKCCLYISSHSYTNIDRSFTIFWSPLFCHAIRPVTKSIVLLHIPTGRLLLTRNWQEVQLLSLTTDQHLVFS